MSFKRFFYSFPAEARKSWCGIPFLLCLALISGCGGNGSNSGTATNPSLNLTWEAPVTRVDGSPLGDLAGFNIYSRNASQNDFNLVSKINNPAVRSSPVPSLPPGEYYLVVTAFDSHGVESGYSNVVPEGSPLRIGP